jgi:bisphosphoglycerate-dependent phosphoglycerate mutase
MQTGDHIDKPWGWEQVLELNLATGVPLVYELDADGSIQSKKILE